MKRQLLVAVVVGAIGFAAPAALAGAVRVEDPVGAISDPEGNKGYVEVVAPEDVNDIRRLKAVVRLCNEKDFGVEPGTGVGDGTVLRGGYLWVNPNGEDARVMYGNDVVGTGVNEEEPARDCPNESN